TRLAAFAGPFAGRKSIRLQKTCSPARQIPEKRQQRARTVLESWDRPTWVRGLKLSTIPTPAAWLCWTQSHTIFHLTRVLPTEYPTREWLWVGPEIRGAPTARRHSTGGQKSRPSPCALFAICL